MATIAVTGGTGLVGRHLVPLLCARGHRLRLLTRSREAHAWLAAQPEVTLVDGDLCDEAALDRLVDDADAVLHMAYAEPGATAVGGRSATQAWFDTNLLGTVRLLERVPRLRARRLVYTSSLAVFSRDPNLDPRGHGLRRDEQCALLPLEFYGSLRAACEPLLRTAAHAYGFCTSIWRLGCVFGLREPWPASPFASTVAAAVRTGAVGEPYGVYAIAVEDAAAILADALVDDSVRGETFHVFDRWIEHGEVARLVAAALGRPIAVTAAAALEPRAPILGDKIHARHRAWTTDARLGALVRDLVARCRDAGA
jgi:UDP-glucose 4-epimerase